jgi:DNA invertase Pin-like site-specific DNA recombinase
MLDQQNKPRAAILARCSSEANVCNQVLVLRQHAIGKYLVEEDDVYADHISGSSAIEERAELTRLMQNVDAQKKQYDVVLVQDASRLGKNPDQVHELVKWFATRNVQVQMNDVTTGSVKLPE